MKKSINIFIFIIIGLNTYAQTALLSGTVKDEKGTPVTFAFLHDDANKFATFTDSTGSFKFMVNPTATITVLATGYKDGKVAIENKTNVDVVLQKDGQAVNNVNQEVIASAYYQKLQSGNIPSTFSQKVREGYAIEPTRGSTLLFTNWMHGFAINNSDDLQYDINSWYNYDKLTGDIIYTTNGSAFSKVNKAGVKAIYLYNGQIQPSKFVHVDALPNKVFTEILINTTQYQLYKKIDTKLVDANYLNNGVTESGHKYDEYVDAVKYYFLKLPNGQPQSISLKKSAIKKAFEGNADKFIDASGNKEINDNYLKDLGDTLK